MNVGLALVNVTSWMAVTPLKHLSKYMYVPLDKSGKKWNDYSLVIASVSVGNVGQFVADLLIFTLKAQKIGFINHNSILPLIGNDPYVDYCPNKGSLMTSCEVYEDRINKLIIIQQRTPFAKGRRGIYRKFLISWIKLNNFKLVINFTSTFSYVRNDIQIQSVPLRFLCNLPVEEKYLSAFNNLNWTNLEESKGSTNEMLNASKENSSTNTDMEDSIHEQILKDGFEDLALDPINQVSTLVKTFKVQDVSHSHQKTKDAGEFETISTPKYNILGGGISQKLFIDCCKADIPLLILMKFCDEGDNTIDAIQLINYYNQWANLIIQKTKLDEVNLVNKPWKIPPSWKLFFGNNLNSNVLY